ncbi:MAG: NirA family protein [Verrucomicrobiales bacterium]|nr:NirA family protein [Verrucomicrobiales bacterium]
MSTLPKEIAGAPLSSEQTQYLDGFFQGMKNRGLSFSDAAPEDGPKPKKKKLTPEEQIKQAKDPFDGLADIRAKAKNNEAPGKEDIFRFKWNGLFWLAPVHEGYMCRLRIPGGVVSTTQFRELASIADDIASGYLQLTTRNNVQIRIIQPKDTLELLQRVEACGLKTRGSGADNLRNFTATPTSGIDPYELIDVMPFIDDLAHLVQNSAEFYDLPRKFNISFDSGGIIGVAEDTNDIGMRAVKMGGEVFFRILLGGVTGHGEFAEDAGFLCKPDDAVDVCAALTRVWMQNGSRNNRGKARMIYLIKEWGYAKYMEETQKLLGFDLIPFNESDLDEIKKPVEPHPQIGSYPQKQDGLNYLGVYTPVGLLPTAEARAIAEIADQFGSGELRLTIFQNLLIPNIPDDRLDAAKAALDAAGIKYEASFLRGGAAACTGNKYCKYASSNTKDNTLDLIDYLESKITLDQPINIHTTGCPHSCAQHYIGDLGLLACKVKIEGQEKPVEGYHVFVGGGFGAEKKRLGRQLLKSIPAGPVLHEKIEALLLGYLEKRMPGETFLDFTTRHSIEELEALVAA